MPTPYEELVQGPQEHNPYADTLEEQNRTAETTLKAAQRQAVQQSPERAAESQKLSQRTGLPADLIERNFEDIKKRSQVVDTDYSKMLRETPKTADFLSNPENAAIAQDDHAQLGVIEKLVRSLGAGLYQAIPGFSGLLEGLGRAAPYLTPAESLDAISAREAAQENLKQNPRYTDPLTQAIGDRRKLQEATLQSIRGNREGEGGFARAVYSGAESITQMISLLPLSLIGGEALVLAGMGATTGGQAMSQAGDQGVEPLRALEFGAGQGLIEAGTELLPVHFALDQLKIGGKFSTFLLKELGSEVAGEETATLLQDLNEWAVLPENKDKTFRDYLADRPGAAAETLVATLVGTLGFTGLTHAVSRAVHGKAPQQVALEQLGEAVKASKTGQRVPEALQKFLGQASEDARVYLPAEELRQFFQDQKIVPSQFMDQVTEGGASKYQEALAAGHDVELPLSDFATKILTGEHAEAFNQMARVGSPEAMNARELDELAKQETPESTPETTQAPVDRIREDLTGQLTGLGFQPEAVQAYASYEAAKFQRLAERAGVDPFELYQRYNLKIARPLPEILRNLPQTDVNLDTLIDRLRSGAEPSQQEMFGKSLLDFLKEKGGVKDEGGDLASREPDKSLKPFEKRLIQPKTGLPLDRARELAAEAGYLDKQTSISDFLDVIEKELRGEPVFAQGQENPQAITDAQALDELGQYLKSRDIDVRNTDNATIKQLLQEASAPAEGPAFGQFPLPLDDAFQKYLGQVRQSGGEPAVKLIDEVRKGGPRQGLAFQMLLEAAPDVDHEPLRQVVAKARNGLYQTLNLDQRARIVFGDNGPTIELLEKADLSSFLHEMAHFHLEAIGDIVDELKGKEGLTPEQQGLVDDYQKILDWLGVKNRSEIGREQHEQWARGNEAYLREGRAPSPTLRRIFNRFASWLRFVYQELTQLNVHLTDEVRGVMDRLVASDTEIEQARQEAGILALIEDQGQAERLGLSPDEHRAYRDTLQKARDAQQEKLRSEYLDEYSRYQTEWYQARRAEVREAVAQEVHSQREYIALSFLQDGTLPDGSALPNGIEGLKLNAGSLEATYGKYKDSSVMQKLRKLDVYRREGGQSADTIADLLGYSSGDELVQALVNARPMDELIDAETNDRMRQSYGDMLTDGTAAEKAKEAVMTVGRSEVIEAEMKALAKKAKEVAPFVSLAVRQERLANRQERAAGLRDLRTFIPSVALARDVAEKRITEMRVRDIRPGLYYTAARRESMAAIEATNAGDFVKALAAKQKELINVEMYRAATETQKEVEKIRQYMRTFDNTDKRGRIGKAGESYLDQIDALRERFDFGKITQKQIDRRASLLDWVADQQSKGLPVNLPAELLNEARRKNYKDMTVEELRGLRDGVAMIEHFARFKNKLLKDQAKRELEAAVGDMVTSIDGNSKGPRARKFEVRLPQDRLARTVSSWFAAHRKLSSFLREMDGFKDGGQMWESIMRPINEAANDEAIENAAATRRLAEIFDEAFAGQESDLYRKTYISAINGSLSKMGRIMVALNWGNEANRQRLRDGHGWTDQQVQAILETLSEKDWKFVTTTADFINSYWPRISDKQQRVEGVRPEKVEASPFSVKVEGKTINLPGWYFPIKYEGQLSARASSDLEGSFADSIKKASYARATTQRGHTEARVENVKEPVRLDFGVITEHLQQVIHDLTHHEMLIDVGRLLSNRKVQDAIYNFYGNDVVYENIKGVIRDVAWGNMPAPSWYRPLNALRQGVVTASLGWNLVTSALQPFQVSNAMVRVGPKWVMKGFTRWARNAASMESTAKWIEERSEFMRTRGQTQFREINEIRNRVGLDRGRVSGWIHDSLHKLGVDAQHMPAIADSYFYLIQKAQQIADIPTWLGAYEKAMDGGETEDRAVDMADQAVIDSQASGHIKDLAAVERRPLLKILTTFYSYNNLLLNQAYEVAKKNEGVTRKLIDASLLMFIPSAIAFFIHGLAGGFDDDKDMAEQLIRQELSDLFGMMIGLRELSGPIQGRDYEGPAGTRYVTAIAKTVKQVGQGEADPAFWRSLNQTGGVFFHYPATQVQRTAEGIEALWSGKSQNPAVLLFGPPRQ